MQTLFLYQETRKLIAHHPSKVCPQALEKEEIFLLIMFYLILEDAAFSSNVPQLRGEKANKICLERSMAGGARALPKHTINLLLIADS